MDMERIIAFTLFLIKGCFTTKNQRYDCLNTVKIIGDGYSLSGVGIFLEITDLLTEWAKGSLYARLQIVSC